MAKKIPSEFEYLSEDGRKAFFSCNTKQQAFLVELLANGCTGSESYRRAYDNKTANDSCASSSANQLTNIDNVSKVIQEYSKKNWLDIVESKRALKDALNANKTVFSKNNEPLDIEDHPTRIKAAVEVLKANDEYVEKSDQTISPCRGI